MPKGGNCTMDGFNCAIYDSKGNPGSHRCRALKGVAEDDNCVCNPPSQTRSGARCSFRKDRNERRRDARAVEKINKNKDENLSPVLGKEIQKSVEKSKSVPFSYDKLSPQPTQKQSPSSQPSQKQSPSPQGFLQKFNKRFEDEKNAPKLSPLEKIYESLQIGLKPAPKITSRRKPLQDMQKSLIELSKKSDEIKHPLLKSDSDK